METFQIRIKFWFDCKIFKVCIILAFWSYYYQQFFLLAPSHYLASGKGEFNVVCGKKPGWWIFSSLVHWVKCCYWKEKQHVRHFCNLKVLKIGQREIKTTKLLSMICELQYSLRYLICNASSILIRFTMITFNR